ncbi:MAG: HAMP domain-containing protein [Prevotella sp.]|nr:HAMP domain-containing protein [Prevotella sp.]
MTNRLFRNIREHLSLRLGINIVLIITVVFSLLFGFLFYHCKSYIQRVAIVRATQLLDNTVVRINGIMDETELVTKNLAQTMPRYLHPDSLLTFSRRAIVENTFLTGMAISMEPNFFPEMGRYYSAYSLRHRALDIDSITTVREGPFEYFEAPWYKTPRSLGRDCWVDAYDDYNEGTLSSPDFLTSYCCPMRDDEGHYIGSVTASLTLKWLSQAVTELKPYPHSSAIMIGRSGVYLAHPDTAKLFRENIFSDADPKAQHDITALGKSMLAGHNGMIETIVDGQDAFIFYTPLERTGWSIAIVCPASDIFARYNQLFATVMVIIAVGLLLLLLVCYQIVRRAIQPLHLLDEQVNHIAEGHFDAPLPESPRHDSVGRLTNSFILMQRSLSRMVRDIRQTNEKLSTLNAQLTEAYRLKVEANRKRANFIHFMYHEIRTPLNIISGFAQVLAASHHSLEANELEDIMTRMQKSANDISRLTRELGETANDYPE